VKREIFADEHVAFRERFARFADDRIAPRVAEWDRRGVADRETWLAMGQEGFLGLTAPREHGGGGRDFLYNVVIMEELARVRAHALMFWLHAEIGISYLTRFGSAPQQERYLPGMIRGEILFGLALTEAAAGSNLAAIETRAELSGDGYTVRGAKVFISHSELADLFAVAVRTLDKGPPGMGVSLLLVEGSTPGLTREGRFEKLGLRGQDTGHLRFDDCRVPAANLLGRRDRGFQPMMLQLERERLCLAITSLASCRRTLADTIDHARRRQVFGAPLASMQNTRFVLAELATEIEIGQAYVDAAARALAAGADLGKSGTMAKLWTTTLQRRLTTECLQLHGGRGLLATSPIATDFADAAVQTVHGGASEVLKALIAGTLGLDS
jgi:alkylation response protein AidB-like acyl-CoA dehydrogenase